MGLLGKILLIVACAIGIACTLGAIITYRNVIQNPQTNAEKATVACSFIALFIFAGLILFAFITMCCPCSDVIQGIVGTVAGAAALFFSIAAYCAYHKLDIDQAVTLPIPPEWLFGALVSGASLILVALTLALG
ncbi:unnamed protein product [Dicrocoelium dendriticum]|nr:unnamed protein product [Dicrocoelium dendriticum]